MNNDRPDRLAATLALDESVGRVRLVSPARARALDGLGIRTVRDLATHFPRRYIDLSRKATVAAGVIGEQCTVEGAVHEIKLKKPKPRLTLVELSLVDGTGVLMVTCFRQPWLMDQVKPGMRIAVAGKLEFNYGFKRMTNPYLEVLDGEGAAEGMIIPVHPACEKISAAWMRRLVGNALEAVRGLHDPLPLELRAKYRLMSRGAALSCIHFPHAMDEVAEARRRLVYEELLLLELMLMRESRERTDGCEPVVHAVDGPRMTALAEAVPFRLTDEQEEAKRDILAALAAPQTANHLLLGDVADLLRSEIKRYMDARGIPHALKYIDPSYIIRSVPATANDKVYCGFLGQYAVHAAMAGRTDMVVGKIQDRYVHLPLELVTRRRRKLNIYSDLWRAALESTGQGMLAGMLPQQETHG